MQQRNKYQMKEQGKTPEERIEMEIGTTLRDQKSTIEKEILPKYKYMEAKQYAPEKPGGQCRYQKGSQKISKNK